MTDDKIDTRGAVDLSEVATLAAARQAAAAEREQTAAQVRILDWDRAMTRAFKGIFPRSLRMQFLKQEHARAVRNGEIEG